MERSKSPTVLDIEASGFGRGSYPIEIGVATADGQAHSWLVRPEMDWTHWQAEAQQLHGITRVHLESEGLRARDVADTLNEMLEGQTLYSDGWGVDSGWLSRLYHAARKTMFFRLDTLPRILSDYQLQHWAEVKEMLREKHRLTQHRAAQDAKLLQLTYQQTALDEQLQKSE